MYELGTRGNQDEVRHAFSIESDDISCAPAVRHPKRTPRERQVAGGPERECGPSARAGTNHKRKKQL